MECKVVNENTIIINKDGVKYLQFKKLLEYDEIVHCFTLKPLDLGNKIVYEEKKAEITANYMKLCNSLNLKYADIIRPAQSHTDNVKIVNEKVGIYAPEYKNVDGLITNRSNKILSLTYADCTPLYFWDPVKKVIANTHSGWKGTLKRIGQKTVEMMIAEYNCNPKNIICIIGPSIGKCHFDIGEDVKVLFFNEFQDMRIKKYIVPNETNNEKYRFDMGALNIEMLKRCGLLEKNIINSNVCTMCNSDYIYSRRIDRKGKEGNLALMCLK